MNLEKPQAMSKHTLYNLYYPGRGKKGVYAFLKSQVYNSPELMERLKKTGFRKKCKWLSIVHVGLIFEHLTPPIKLDQDEILHR